MKKLFLILTGVVGITIVCQNVIFNKENLEDSLLVDASTKTNTNQVFTIPAMSNRNIESIISYFANKQDGAVDNNITNDSKNDDVVTNDEQTKEVVKEDTTSKVVEDNTTKDEVKENIESKVVEKQEEKLEEKQELDDKLPEKKEPVKKFNLKKLNPTQDKKILLVDKSNGICAQAIEYFYEDTYYKYYFTCIKSGSMYVIKNNKEYKLVDALNNGIVTMSELNENGYSFPKVSKNVVSK